MAGKYEHLSAWQGKGEELRGRAVGSCGGRWRECAWEMWVEPLQGACLFAFSQTVVPILNYSVKKDS